MSVNNQTPPMSPIYMPMTNDPDPEIVRYGTKGVKRNRGTRVKQTSRKSTGGKTPKRVLKEMNKDKDSLDYVTEDIDFLFNDDQEDRNKTRTPFQKMELPSEYCETHYYGCISMNKKDMVYDNKFWVDLATHLVLKKTFKGFLSRNFIL